MAKLNREEIQAALKAYLNARLQHEAILADTEIQHWFSVENDAEANEIIAQRYPFGKWETVHSYAIALISAMYRCAPVTIEPERLWADPKNFNEALRIAAQV